MNKKLTGADGKTLYDRDLSFLLIFVKECFKTRNFEASQIKQFTLQHKIRPVFQLPGNNKGSPRL